MNNGLEAFIRTAIEAKTKYCHAFATIPSVRVGVADARGNFEDRLFQAADGA